MGAGGAATRAAGVRRPADGLGRRVAWIAACVVAGVTSVITGYADINSVGMLHGQFMWWLMLVITLLRFGLVGTVVGLFSAGITVQIPFAPSLSAWYGQTALVSQAVLLVLVIAAFIVSLGGRPMFGGTTLEDA